MIPLILSQNINKLIIDNLVYTYRIFLMGYILCFFVLYLVLLVYFFAHNYFVFCLNFEAVSVLCFMLLVVYHDLSSSLLELLMNLVSNYTAFFFFFFCF